MQAHPILDEEAASAFEPAFRKGHKTSTGHNRLYSMN